jgi:hypothetical protein
VKSSGCELALLRFAPSREGDRPNFRLTCGTDIIAIRLLARSPNRWLPLVKLLRGVSLNRQSGAKDWAPTPTQRCCATPRRMYALGVCAALFCMILARRQRSVAGCHAYGLRIFRQSEAVAARSLQTLGDSKGPPITSSTLTVEAEKRAFGKWPTRNSPSEAQRRFAEARTQGRHDPRNTPPASAAFAKSAKSKFAMRRLFSGAQISSGTTRKVATSAS